MYRDMRRKDREITSVDEYIEILVNNNLGFLSTINEDSSSYVVPVNYFYEDNCIYFHSSKEGHKIDNMKNNPIVSFAVVGKNEINLEKFTTSYESVVIFGKASFIEDFDEKLSILNKMMASLGRIVDVEKHYKPSVIQDDTSVIQIKINRITGKRNRTV